MKHRHETNPRYGSRGLAATAFGLAALVALIVLLVAVRG